MSGRARLRFADALREALHGVVAQPVRTLVPASTIVLGVALVVMTTGFRDTSNAALAERIDRVRPNTVVVTAAQAQTDSGSGAVPAGVAERIAALPGVVAVGERWTVGVPVAASTSPAVDGPEVRLFGVSAGALAPLRAGVEGRVFGGFAVSRGEPVAVVTRDLARTLRLAGLGSRPTVIVGDVVLTVTGIVPNLAGPRGSSAGTAGAVLVPASVVPRLVDPATAGVTKDLIVTTERGQTGPVTEILGRTVNQREQVVSIQDEADASGSLRTAQREQGRAGTVLVLAVTLAAFASILVTTLGSVARRTPEIGLRRSVGAHPVHIGAQVLLEATMTALVASIVGAALGTIVVAVVAVARGWTPVVGSGVLPAAVLGGVVIALVASVYPAVRATLVDPITALRRH